MTKLNREESQFDSVKTSGSWYVGIPKNISLKGMTSPVQIAQTK